MAERGGVGGLRWSQDSEGGLRCIAIKPMGEKRHPLKEVEKTRVVRGDGKPRVISEKRSNIIGGS